MDFQYSKSELGDIHGKWTAEWPELDLRKTNVLKIGFFTKKSAVILSRKPNFIFHFLNALNTLLPIRNQIVRKEEI